MFRIAICDKDKDFTGIIETLILQESDKIRISIETEVYFNGISLLKDLKNGVRYDMIFVLAEMQPLNGIETAKNIRKIDKNVLLFCLAQGEQNLEELFEVDFFRCLSKPIDKIKFHKYFQQAIKYIGEKEPYYQFSFKKEFRKVAYHDILYFESRNRVIHIFLRDHSEEKFYGKLNDIEKELLEKHQCFFRIHQSFLVNYNYIKKMNFSSVILSAGTDREIQLKVSENRQKALRLKLSKMSKEIL